MDNTIIVDIDHTVSNAFHRDRMIKGWMSDADWSAYHAMNGADESYSFMAKMINNFYSLGYEIVFLTSREEENRKQTEAWLKAHEFAYDALYMRPDRNRDPSHVLKVNILKEVYQNDFSCIEFAIDDNRSFCDEYVKLGIKTIECRFGKQRTRAETLQF